MKQNNSSQQQPAPGRQVSSDQQAPDNNTASPNKQAPSQKSVASGSPAPANTAPSGAPSPEGNMIKDPKDWTTGDEPMTGAQRSYLHTLAGEAGEQIPNDMTKAEASQKIEELQQKTGRGLGEQEKAKE
ncbi:MAG TPA: DUF3072 domain-containing protein [Puia sp.]|nr:DUF3072 domain-containing protein [Puia sp.]